jgi:hypothetical protein
MLLAHFSRRQDFSHPRIRPVSSIGGVRPHNTSITYYYFLLKTTPYVEVRGYWHPYEPLKVLGRGTFASLVYISFRALGLGRGSLAFGISFRALGLGLHTERFYIHYDEK